MVFVRTLKGSVAVALAAILLSSCATRTGSTTTTVRRSENGSVKDIDSFHLSDPEGPKVVDTELENIPSEVNPMVEKWITYFTGKGRPHMERYLARSTRYEKLMKKVLRDNGLPEDIFYIAMIESGFSSRAVSHASAVGYWQFIRGTGKRYGLAIDRFMDERRDPVLATQAAADYFKGLYSVFGSWYLAMASYNVGENRVKKEVMNHYTRDFWELAKKNRFPKETINYIPKYIAAKLIAKNPTQYGFGDIDYMPPIEFDSVTLDAPVNLRVMSEKMNYNYEDFKALNPKFKGEIAPLTGAVLDLRIPVGQREIALNAAKESVVDKVEYIADSGDTQVYKIRRGDNLHTIAKRFRTTVAYLRDLNDIQKGKRLRVGMKIHVPDRTPVSDKRAVIAKKSVSPASSSQAETTTTQTTTTITTVETEGTTRYYIVQSGDSLFTIAKRYKTTVHQLKKLNNIQRGRTLRIGLKLRLPGDPEGDGTMPQENQSTYNPDSRRASKKVRNVAAAKAKPSKKIVKHTVRRGESLHTIAQKYKVDVTTIRDNNRLRNPSKLFIGSRLIIPLVTASN